MDLEDEIFGIGGELSDVDSDEGEQAPADYSGLAAAALSNLYNAPVEDEDEGSGSDEEDDDAGGSGDDYRAADKAPKDRALPKFKKAKRQREAGEEDGARPKKQARNKRRKKAQSDEEDDAPMDPETERRQRLSEKLDRILKKPASKKKKKDAGEEDLGIAEEDEVIKLRQDMMHAVHQDVDANNEHRPAVHKLQMLGRVVETMQKQHFALVALDNGVLTAMKDWLKPMPDKSLPSLTIQRSLFQILLNLSQIDNATLKESEIGKVVLFYTKCPRVEPTIKRQADQLITTWLRPLLRRSAAWRDRPIQVAEEPDRPAARRRPAASQAPAPVTSAVLPPAVLNSAANARRAQIPQAISTAYAVAPRSRVAAADERAAAGNNMDRFKAFSSRLKSAKKKQTG